MHGDWYSEDDAALTGRDCRPTEEQRERVRLVRDPGPEPFYEAPPSRAMQELYNACEDSNDSHNGE